ncbi:unnamed protein product, partial [Phaeothamnion confervicola]
GEGDEADAAVAVPSSPSSQSPWELSEADSAAMMAWTVLGIDLHPALTYHLRRLSFLAPTPVQRLVLPKAVLSRSDVLGAAETGSGKTLAYGLPILQSILRRRDAEAAAALAVAVAGAAAGDDSGDGAALILCPTRELALQVTQHLTAVTKGTGVRVATRAAAVVAVSASSAAAAVAAVNPTLPEGLVLTHVRALQEDKDVMCYLFCEQYNGRTLVFVNSIAGARRLTALLVALRLPAAALHAQMQQRQRLRNLDRFRESARAILVATDVAARGLDVPAVNHVVHYDLPSPEVFIHRSGRTARAAAAGLALAVVSPADEAHYARICRVLG